MTPDWDAMLVVGRVARPHGLRGEVAVMPETDFPEERFRPGNVLYANVTVGARPLTVASMRVHQGRPLIRFEGVESLDDAEVLRRAELRMPLDAMGPLPEGTYRHADLVGCEVVTPEGSALGRVTRVDGGAGSSLLVVAGTRGEVLVPMVAAFCESIDIAARRIVVSPPEGLLELNEWRVERR